MRSAAKLLVIVLLIACPATICTAQERGIRSPDGKTLAIARNDCTLVLRDVASGNRIATLHGTDPPWHPYWQRSCHVALSFSPDGKVLATHRSLGPVTLWDAQSGRKLATLGGSDNDGDSLAFSNDSRLLLTVIKTEAASHKFVRSNGISVWDVATQKELLRVREDQKTEFKKVVLSPDGKTVAALVGSRVGHVVNRPYVTDKIRLWDIETAKELVTLKGQVAVFLPDDKLLLLTDSGCHMIWDIKAGKMSTAAQDLTLTADNVANSTEDNKWNWTVFVKGDQQDMDNIICVEYTLHPTFPNPVRLVSVPGDAQRPFGLSATGWGTFSIAIRVFMKDGTHQDLKHQLKF